jgi:DNA-binding CsgD family transcriptional regulator
MGAELRFEQVRALMQLFAEANEMRADPARNIHLLGGVRRLIGATVAGFVTDCDFHPKGLGLHTAVVLDGWDATTLPALTILGKEGSKFSPGIRAMMRACGTTPGATQAATREELVEDDAWYGSEYVQSFLIDAHLDHAIYSCTRGLAPTVVHGLGFHRERGDAPFDESDRALVHLFQLQCERFFASPAKAVTAALRMNLSPRQRETLSLLLGGFADKEIADAMGISPYTVNQYCKSIYRHFGVRSRASLISLVLGR